MKGRERERESENAVSLAFLGSPENFHRTTSGMEEAGTLRSVDEKFEIKSLTLHGKVYLRPPCLHFSK
jgi:hypothetical protein